MILYDSDFKLLGISKVTLELIGCPSLGVFFAKHNDIDEFFIQRDKYLKLSENHFIADFIRYKMNYKDALILSEDGKEQEVIVCLDTFYMKDVIAPYYVVKLIKKDSIHTANSRFAYYLNELNTLAEENSKKSKLPNAFLTEYKRESDKYITKTDREKLENAKLVVNFDINEKWLDGVSKRLDIDTDELKEMLVNFINEAKDKEEELYEAVLLRDKVRSQEIIAFLLDPVNTLGIRPLKEALEKLENSSSDEVSENFRTYQNILENISKIVMKGNKL